MVPEDGCTNGEGKAFAQFARTPHNSHFIKFVGEECSVGANRFGQAELIRQSMEINMAIPTATVLIVEDEPLIRLSLAAAAEDAGYRVLEASNVLEAVAIIARTNIDALITDVDMPGGLSGLDLAELVSEVTAAAIVVVSGRRLPESYSLPERATYLSKPYDFDHLLLTVARSVAQARVSDVELLSDVLPREARASVRATSRG